MIDPRSARDVVVMLWDSFLDWVVERAVQIDELGRLDTEGDAPAGLAGEGGPDAEASGDTGAPAGPVREADQVGPDQPLDALPAAGG